MSAAIESGASKGPDIAHRHVASAAFLARFNTYITTDNAIKGIPLSTSLPTATLLSNAELTLTLKSKWAGALPDLYEAHRRRRQAISRNIAQVPLLEVEELAALSQRVDSLRGREGIPTHIVPMLDARLDILRERANVEEKKRAEKARLQKVADFYASSAFITIRFQDGRETSGVRLPDGSDAKFVSPNNQRYLVEMGKTMIAGDFGPTREVFIRSTMPEYSDPNTVIPVEVSERVRRNSEKTSMEFLRRCAYPVETQGEGLTRAHKASLPPGEKFTPEIRAALASPTGEYNEEAYREVIAYDYVEGAVVEGGRRGAVRDYVVLTPEGDKATVYSKPTGRVLSLILSTLITDREISAGEIMDNLGATTLDRFGDWRRVACGAIASLYPNHTLQIKNPGKGRATTFLIKDNSLRTNGQPVETSSRLDAQHAERLPIEEVVLNPAHAHLLAIMAQVRRDVTILFPNQRTTFEYDGEVLKAIGSLASDFDAIPESFDRQQVDHLRGEAIHRMRMIFLRTDADHIISSHDDPRVRRLLERLKNLFGLLEDHITRFFIERPISTQVVENGSYVVGATHEWRVPIESKATAKKE